MIPSQPIETANAIPSHKLQKWAIEQVHCEEEQQLNLRFEVYASLLDTRVRTAWVSDDPLEKGYGGGLVKALRTNVGLVIHAVS